MECLSGFFDQILKAVVEALPTLIDWVITSLGG